MATLRAVLFVIFVIDSILLVIAVLLQSGRGGGLAGALGGIGGADSALGVRAASQIEKATGVLAAIFMVIAVIMAFIATGKVPEPESTKFGTRETTPAASVKNPSAPASVKKPSEPAAVKPPTVPATATTAAAKTGP